jgi:hypothetical protein
MRFMVVVKADKASEAGEMPGTKLLAAMGKYNQELLDAGVLRGAEGLHPSSRGKRVKFDHGNVKVIDGPFAESKELIAGFWIFETKSLAETVDWVKRCPFAREGQAEVEIRQLFEESDFPADVVAETPEAFAAERELQRRQKS